jgi:hypothetical protein
MIEPSDLRRQFDKLLAEHGKDKAKLGEAAGGLRGAVWNDLRSNGDQRTRKLIELVEGFIQRVTKMPDN